MRESFKKMKQNDFMKQLHYQLRRDALGTWVEITACQGTGRIINIPSEIQGYLVRAIGPRAFYHKHTLEEIRLPDTIEWIGSSALRIVRNWQCSLFRESCVTWETALFAAAVH